GTSVQQGCGSRCRRHSRPQPRSPARPTKWHAERGAAAAAVAPEAASVSLSPRPASSGTRGGQRALRDRRGARDRLPDAADLPFEQDAETLVDTAPHLLAEPFALYRGRTAGVDQ